MLMSIQLISVSLIFFMNEAFIDSIVLQIFLMFVKIKLYPNSVLKVIQLLCMFDRTLSSNFVILESS